MSTCTPDQVDDAIGYLRRSFTCYDLDFQAEKSLRRTFAKYTTSEVLDAIEELKSHSEHWPVAAAIETEIRRQRGLNPKGSRARRDGWHWDEYRDDSGDIQPIRDFTAPAESHARVTELRTHAAQAVGE